MPAEPDFAVDSGQRSVSVTALVRLSASNPESESMTYQGLIGAVLYAKDLGRPVEFYSSVAGIEPQAMEEGFAVLGTKPSQFLIVRMPKRIAETIDIAAPPEPRQDTPIKLVSGVKDIASPRRVAASWSIRLIRTSGIQTMPTT
jgi:hypothetical protein